jgi:hypothetical protein
MSSSTPSPQPINNTISAPTFVASVLQGIIAEPLGGSRETFYYINEVFPDAIYRKSPSTNLYALMDALFGDAGLGFIQKQYFQARLILQEMGLDLTDLDSFFANPFGFQRSLTETYTPPNGPITFQQEQSLRSRDSGYYSRALNYLQGARAGNTPLGMQKVAEAGLGHGVAIVENYKYFYDQHSDAPMGLPYYGQTASTNEFIIIPTPEVSTTPVIELQIEGVPTGGEIIFSYGLLGQPDSVSNTDLTWVAPLINTASVGYLADRNMMMNAIGSLAQVGAENVYVTGEPGGPWYINFQGNIDTDSIQLLNIYNNLTGNDVVLYITTLYGVLNANQEQINTTSENIYTLFQALKRIKPVNSFPTLYPGAGVYRNVFWQSVTATTEFNEVVRFVTGNPAISWPSPPPDKYWIEASVEKQAPRVYKDIQYAYAGWHNIGSITASTQGTTTNLPTANGPVVTNYTAAQALANYPEPLWVTSSEASNMGFDSYIQGIYPIEYASLSGAPPIAYTNHFWVSQPAPVGTNNAQEFLIIDFGVVQAVNYLTFDMVPNAIQVDVFYDTFDDSNTMNFVQVTPIVPYNNVVTGVSNNSPIITMGLAFSNSLSQVIFTRRIKIVFTRLSAFTGQIAVQNLRLGRVV